MSAATLETYENDLHATWRHKLIRTRAIHAAKPAVNQGQLLFSDCIEHEARLNGLEIPRSFTRGSWHALADDSKIGWHPDYQNALTASKSTLDPTQNH